MKLLATLLTVLSLTFNTGPKAHRTAQAYVRVDIYNIERLQRVGTLMTSASPYLMTVYIWDNRISQYVSRQVYLEDGVTPLTGTTTYPIIIPRAGEEDGAEIP